ncbi:MAG: LamG-like jellyroll fold domain-containing protein [Acidimicrobiales bacterium]
MTTATPIAIPPPRLDLPLDLFEVSSDKKNWVTEASKGAGRKFEIHGNPTIVPDDTFGSALVLNGTDTWIDLGRIGDLLPGRTTTDKAFSISMWVKVADSRQKSRSLLSFGRGWTIDLDSARKPKLSMTAVDPKAVQASIAAGQAEVAELRAMAASAEAEAKGLSQVAEAARKEAEQFHAEAMKAKAKMDRASSLQRAAMIVGFTELAAASQERTRAAEHLGRAAEEAERQAKLTRAAADGAVAPTVASQGEALSVTSSGSPAAIGEWAHLVGVYDGKQILLYVDGVAVGNGQLGGRAASVQYRADDRVVLGTDTEQSSFLGAQVAQLQYFGEALTTEQLQLLRSSDLSMEAAFHGRYPFSFDFTDDEIRDVIYIADVGANVAKVTITNTSGAPLTMRKLPASAVPSASNHHFELRFRPSTFKARKADVPAAVLKGLTSESWNASSKPQVSPDGVSMSLYLSWTGSRNKVLQPNDSISFDLEYQSADGQMGSRGTNVILGYRNVDWASDDNLQIDVGGERIRSIDVISRTGKPNLPLHVGFVGSNRVLNVDNASGQAAASAGGIKIRMLNAQPAIEDQPTRNRVQFRSIKGPNGVSADQASKFTVSFDTSGDWALTDTDKAVGVNVLWRVVRSGSPGPEKMATRSTLGTGAAWTFQPDFDELSPGDAIDIELNGITSTESSGLSNIYIHYEDVPGHWDGQYVLAVEKAPMVFDSKRVGIGGYPGTVPEGGLTISGAGGHSVDLVVNGRMRSGNNNGGLWINEDRFFGGHSTDRAGIYNNGWRMTVKKDGKVGIGTIDPETPLQITGGIDCDHDGGGYLVLGPTNGTNLVIDDNELIARNNKKASTLYFNSKGGLVWVGEGGLQVAGKSTLDGDVKVNKALTVAGKATVHGDVKLKKKLEVAGNVQVGQKLTLVNPNAGRWTLQTNNYTDGTNKLAFRFGSSTKFEIKNNGDMQQHGGSWIGPSDARLKSDIRDLEDPVAVVRELRPRAFRWIESGTPDLGFIAQEVEAVAPELVNNDADVKGMSYNQFIALAIGAIQQQQVQIDELKAKLSSDDGSADGS